VQRGEGMTVGREDRQPLVARGGRKAAGAAGIGDDLEVEIPRNRRGYIIWVRRHPEIDGLTARENVVMAARNRRHAHPRM